MDKQKAKWADQVVVDPTRAIQRKSSVPCATEKKEIQSKVRAQIAQDNIQKRLDMGMRGKSASVSVPIDVRTEFGRSSTTKHLRKQRILLDNTAITQKTQDG